MVLLCDIPGSANYEDRKSQGRVGSSGSQEKDELAEYNRLLGQ